MASPVTDLRCPPAVPVTVLVVTEPDAAPAFLAGAARSERCRPVGRVQSVAEASAAVAMGRPDVVVVEVSTFDRLHQLVAAPELLHDARTVVVSALPAELALVTCLAAGAAAFLGSPVTLGLFEQAVAAVLEDGTFVDPRSARWLVDLAVHGRSTRPDSGLTLRQAQVLQLVGVGLTNREIADALAVSAETVKTHVREAMRRLGVHSRWDATARANRRDDSPTAQRHRRTPTSEDDA